MEVQSSPFSWACYNQEEGIEELRHSLSYTTLELETTIVSAHEEIARKEDELLHLKTLLTKAFRERDEAQAKCQSLMLENLLLQPPPPPPPPPSKFTIFSEATSGENEPKGDFNTEFSSPDCNKNNIAMPVLDPILQPNTVHETLDIAGFEEGQMYAIYEKQIPLLEKEKFCKNLDIAGFEEGQMYTAYEKLMAKKALPEKGKLLQAVMEAGPLLRTLLVAGPLPRWHHPPPQLDSIDIPPVTVNSPVARLQHQDSCASTSTAGFTKKRALMHCEDSDCSPNTKYQKVAHQSPLTNC